jgi:hypothetical protein
MGGGIIRPRWTEPHQIIRGLLDTVQTRCSVCKGPATRQVNLKIIGPPEFFCDEHSLQDLPKWYQLYAHNIDYKDGSNSDLIRAAQKWLSENRAEEKT